MSIASDFFAANRAVSRRFSALFPGRTDSISKFAPLVRTLAPAGARVVDIGGGRHPVLTPEEKRAAQLHVIGVDIDAAELRSAPAGAYDEVIASDAADLDAIPSNSVDLVYSRAVAEHVADPRAMFEGTYRILAPGGTTAHYVPNKWALFAMVNAYLPPRLSRRVLYATNPGAEEWAGFKAYYRETTPRRMQSMLQGIGFRGIEVHAYYYADYLDFLFPAHVAYVNWQNAARWLNLASLCESFTIVARK